MHELSASSKIKRGLVLATLAAGSFGCVNLAKPATPTETSTEVIPNTTLPQTPTLESTAQSTAIEAVNLENFGRPKVEWVGDEPKHDWDNLTQAQMEEIYLKSASTKLTDGVNELKFGEIKSYGNGYFEVYGTIVEAPSKGRDIIITTPAFDKTGKKVLITKTVQTKEFPFLIKDDAGKFQIKDVVYSSEIPGFIDDFGPKGIQTANGQLCRIMPDKEWDTKFIQPNTRARVSYGYIKDINDTTIPDERNGIQSNWQTMGLAMSESTNTPGLGFMTITRSDYNISYGKFKSGNASHFIGYFGELGIRIQQGQLAGMCN